MRLSLKIASLLLFTIFFDSCNENTGTTPASTHADSESVKIMGADSNSTMPVHTPKDSTEKIPNAYDSTKK